MQSRLCDPKMIMVRRPAHGPRLNWTIAIIPAARGARAGRQRIARSHAVRRERSMPTGVPTLLAGCRACSRNPDNPFPDIIGNDELPNDLSVKRGGAIEQSAKERRVLTGHVPGAISVPVYDHRLRICIVARLSTE